MDACGDSQVCTHSVPASQGPLLRPIDSPSGALRIPDLQRPQRVHGTLSVPRSGSRTKRSVASPL